jgi:hypothetical protein
MSNVFPSGCDTSVKDSVEAVMTIPEACLAWFDGTAGSDEGRLGWTRVVLAML